VRRKGKDATPSLTAACQCALNDHRAAATVALAWEVLWWLTGTLAFVTLVVLVVLLWQGQWTESIQAAMADLFSGGAAAFISGCRRKKLKEVRAALDDVQEKCGEQRVAVATGPVHLPWVLMLGAITLSAGLALMFWKLHADPTGVVLESVANPGPFAVVQLDPSRPCRQLFLMDDGQAPECAENGPELRQRHGDHPNWRCRLEPQHLGQSASGDVILQYDVTTGSVNGANCSLENAKARLLVRVLDEAGQEIPGSAPWQRDVAWNFKGQASFTESMGPAPGIDLTRARSFEIRFGDPLPIPSCPP
jgi:hypothetical protein